MLDRVGTDLQLISPRPFQMMHCTSPAAGPLVHRGNQQSHRPHVQALAEALPSASQACRRRQVSRSRSVLPELERCVKMGFRGLPAQIPIRSRIGPRKRRRSATATGIRFTRSCASSTFRRTSTPPGSQSERTPYTLHFINEETVAVFGLVNSDVFRDFPKLKILVSHGGGAIPYQLGRFQSGSSRRGANFLDGARKLYYDTVLYTPDALNLLLKTMGPDRCLFGAECPGVGSTIDPATNRTRDDVKPMIDGLEWLTVEQKRAIYEDNARKLFKL